MGKAKDKKPYCYHAGIKPDKNGKRFCYVCKTDLTNLASPEETEPDWKNECEVCGALPTLPLTGMCGPCTFGEADTIGGNW